MILIIRTANIFKKIVGVFLFSIFYFLFSSVTAHAVVTINPNLPGNQNLSSGPVAIVANAYQFALLLAGGLAFAMIVYGAIKYTMSQGNAGMQSDAKDRIYQAFWGLLLLLGAYIILNTVNPAITKLKVERPSALAVPTSTPPTGGGPAPSFCAPGNSITCSQMNECRLALYPSTAGEDTCVEGTNVRNVRGCLEDKFPGIGATYTTGGGQRHSYGSCHYGGSASQQGCGDGRAIDVGRVALNPRTIPLRDAVTAAISCGSPAVVQCFAEYGTPVQRVGNVPNVLSDFDFIEDKPNAHLHCNIANAGCGCN